MTLLRFLAAIPLGVLPGRYWPSLNDRVPIYRGAFFSALATLILALAIGIPGFIRYVHGMLDPATELMLHLYNMKGRAPVQNAASTTAAIQVIQLSTPLAPIFFLFGTPLGLLTTYLGTSSVIRMLAVLVEDPWGDPLLTIADAVVRRSWIRSRARDARILRERREGTEVPDVLVTGVSAGVADADFVVIASRRKPEWDTGAIVVTDDKWFTLGAPFEQQMPGGWRTMYPLTELHHQEVLRRAVRYTLPPLRGTRSTSAQ